MKSLQELPDEVVSFLTDYQAFTFANTFAQTYLGDKRLGSVVSDFLERIVLGELPFQDLRAHIVEEFGLTEEKATPAAIEIATKRLLPIAGVLGNVSGLIAKLGGQVEGGDFVMPAVSAEQFVEGFLAEHSVRMQTPNLQHRLVLAITAFAKGEKTMEELTSFLTRDIKIGGLEMKQEDASRLMKEMKKTIDELKIQFVSQEFAAAPEPPVSTGPKSSVAPPSTPPISVAPIPPPAPTSIPAPAPEKPITPPSAKGGSSSGGNLPLKRGDAKDPVDAIVAPAPEPVKKKEVDPTLREERGEVVKPVEKIELAPEPVVAPKQSVTPPILPLRGPVDVVAEPVQAEPAAVALSGAKDDAFGEEDEKEIAEIATKTKEMRESKGPLVDFDEAKKRIYDASGLTFTDVEMKKRFDKAVESRLRDVRDAYETRNQLESAPEQGGIGLKGSQLAEVSGKIEEIVGKYQGDVAKKTEEEKRARMQQLQRERAAREETLKAKESDVLSKRYAQLTGAPPSHAVNPVAPTGARTSAASPVEDQLARQEKQIDTSRVRQVIQSQKPPAVTPTYSAGTMHHDGRPVVRDVRFERRLAGPAEELRTLTLTDFRRLSADSSKAAQKVKDKIELMALDGFEKRIEGIKAWRQSPLLALYTELTGAAFMNGKSIEAILDERATAGKATLTRNDVSAIMELNAELRF